MIWESLVLMTIIGLLIISASMASLWLFLRHAHRLIPSGLLTSSLAISSGLVVIGLFYFADLFTMHALPIFTNREAAMAAMEGLHLNYSWIAILVGTLAIFIGFTGMIRGLFSMIGNLERSEVDLQHEITERKRVEGTLRLQGQIVDNMAEGVCLIRTTDGVIVYANPKYERMYGYDSGELVGKHISITNAPYDRYQKEAGDEIIQSFKEIGISQGELYSIKKDGVLFWSHAIVSTFDHAGYGEVWIAVLEDITERKRTEEALRNSEELFRSAFARGPIGMVLIGPDNNLLKVNQALCEMLGYSERELTSLTLVELTHPDDIHKDLQLMDQLCKGEILTYNLEKRYIKKTREVLLVNKSAAVIRDREGKVLYGLGMVEDITERKQAEEQIQASLEEKELLLKEIHHRVKNNLQIISSLLNLQSAYLKEPLSIELFKDSQYRVRAMALVHEKLYQSKNLARIDFGLYTRELTTHLLRMYGNNSNTVSLDVIADDITLDIDAAIPMGLIINELITNSLKYAFPAGQRGKISIEFRRDDGHQMTLLVRDNGVGLEKDLDFRNTRSLGLQLVNNLVDQLDGMIELDTKGGTAFKMVFANLNNREGFKET